MKKNFFKIHPLLVAVFPILALRNHNLVYVDFSSIVRSLLIALLMAGVLWAVLTLIFRNSDKAGLITTVVMILFFSYGQVYLQIQNTFKFELRHRYLVLIFAVILVIAAVLILRMKSTDILQRTITVTAGVMVLFAVYQGAAYDLNKYWVNQKAGEESKQQITTASLSEAQKATLPDIYLIVLDAHTRSDILKEHYSLDNSSFIQGLQNMGFYVAPCAQSNYAFTNYSLTSLMFMDYLENFTNMFDLPSLGESTVIQNLKSLGYTTIRFENHVSGHLTINEDIMLSRKKFLFGNFDLTGGPNEFEAELFQTTFLKFFYDLPQLIPGFDVTYLDKSEDYEHFAQTHFILDDLKNVPAMNGPKFVMVHILVPHVPYIFTPDGNFKITSDPVTGYRNNVEFIDSHILPAVQAVITETKRPLIIIMQGDHGPIGRKISPEMRMSILDAYYVNAATRADLYSTITPVNSFRIILNHYFGYNLPLLKDISYYSLKPAKVGDMKVVPNACQ